ncbi:MAG: M23 family metallopeptidase [Pyrinomonadaceae bacterium]
MPLIMFSLPVPGKITSHFGPRVHPVTKKPHEHNGVDFRAATGTPVTAAAPGTVAFAGEMGANGLLVRLDHGGGVETLYAHNSRLLVKAGQVVAQGEKIALAGSTGRSTGSHLHFGVKVKGRHVDPLSVLQKGVEIAAAIVPSAPPTVKNILPGVLIVGLILWAVSR